jgi:transposase
MKGPAQSPDLNPIEILWDAVECQIRGHTYSNGHELFSAIEQAWSKIDQSIIDRLINSMKNQREEVNKNFEYGTRY